MTVAASAGALLGFTTITVKTRSASCGKGCTAINNGHSASHSGSSVSPSSLTMKDGNSYTINSIECTNLNTIFSVYFNDLPDTATTDNAFKTVVLGNAKVVLPDGGAAFNDNYNYMLIGGQGDMYTAMAGAVNSTIICQFRADI
jgi:hypothetical protein